MIRTKYLPLHQRATGVSPWYGGLVSGAGSAFLLAAVLLIGGVFAQTADTTAPSAIADLAVSATTVSSVAMTWTAPGNDGAVGTSTSYDLRYATSVITESTWASSTQAVGEPTPKIAGSVETTMVSGLSSSTTYYFAIKSKDEAGNESAFSNIASGTTLAPPAPTPTPTPASTSGLTFEMKVTPRTLNLSSEGKWVTVQLYLPFLYKANQVDISSVRLNGVFPPDPKFRGTDNINDNDDKKHEKKKSSNLVLKFSREGVQGLADSSANSSALVLTLTGKVSDKDFSASDTIVVFKRIELDDDDDEDDEGDLVQATSSPKVYIIHKGHKRHIPSPQAFERLRLRWENIKIVAEQVLNAFREENLFRASNSPDVYLIIGGMKRHILSPAIFASYGFDWDDITIVSSADLADYPDVSLIRAAGDEKVYLLSGGKKHWISSLAVFSKHGYNWNSVVIINSTEKDAIPEGDNVQ
ncbi:hypothetical protein KJ853_04050 [Patescibacteria group bacterium]|nr:hypothetical protein [Patescibacteria group bacterium]